MQEGQPVHESMVFSLRASVTFKHPLEVGRSQSYVARRDLHLDSHLLGFRQCYQSRIRECREILSAAGLLFEAGDLQHIGKDQQSGPHWPGSNSWSRLLGVISSTGSADPPGSVDSTGSADSCASVILCFAFFPF